MIGNEERAKESEGVTKYRKRDTPASSTRLEKSSSVFLITTAALMAAPGRRAMAGNESIAGMQSRARRFEWAA